MNEKLIKRAEKVAPPSFVKYYQMVAENPKCINDFIVYKGELCVTIPILLLIFIPCVLTLLTGICIYPFVKENLFKKGIKFQIYNQQISIDLYDVLFICIVLFYLTVLCYLIF